MGRYPTTIDPIGVVVFKWIVVPLVVIFVITWGISFEFRKHKCRKAAEQHGYLESNYAPGFRGAAGKCICRKKRNADGTIDVDAVLTLNLD